MEGRVIGAYVLTGSAIKFIGCAGKLKMENIPEGMEIDHINGVRDDNRIDNLRLVTKKENLKNKGMYKSNSSGFTGVSYDKSQDVWVSKISGKLIGKYKSIVDAVESRIVSEVSMKYHINNGGKIR